MVYTVANDPFVADACIYSDAKQPIESKYNSQESQVTASVATQRSHSQVHSENAFLQLCVREKSPSTQPSDIAGCFQCVYTQNFNYFYIIALTTIIIHRKIFAV